MSDALARAFIDHLGDDDLDRLAELLAPRLARVAPGATSQPAEDGWLTSTGAAKHLGLSIDALHKLTAARSIPFAQDGPGAKCWFRRSELDAWREGRS